MVINMNNTKRDFGSIYYNKQRNNWTASWTITDPISGTPKRFRKTFKEKEAAEKHLNEIFFQTKSALYAQNNGIPLVKLIELILEKKLDSNRISGKAFARSQDTIRIIKKWYLSNKNIDEISSDELQNYLNSLTSHYSNSSIEKIYFQIKNAFDYAINKGFIHMNPMFDVMKPKSQKQDKKLESLQIDEQRLLTSHLVSLNIEDLPYKNALLFELYLGLRVGEALALTSSDINLQRNILTVNRTLTTDENNQIVMGNTTKTYAGQRELPIPTFIRPFIIEQLEIAKEHPDHLLFYTPDKRFVNHTTVNRQLKTIAKRLNIQTPITTHVLRHSYATRCIESGMRDIALQRLMGHTDITITLNTYASVFNKYKQEEIDKINEYFINNEIIDKTNALLNANNNLLIKLTKENDDYKLVDD